MEGTYDKCSWIVRDGRRKRRESGVGEVCCGFNTMREDGLAD